MIPDLGILAFTMQDIDRKGIGKIMEMALDHVHRDASGELRPLHARQHDSMIPFLPERAKPSINIFIDGH